jgi:nitroimidazol reductase NimA-like FMN-containing flavoprotein (pyridoxamine 5'-phosphate oxidase superfamily)
MGSQQELGAIAMGIVDANLYMVLGTAGEDGRPWVSPVFYATADNTRFYWTSSPEARHSRNLVVRPDVSVVIFDSRAPAYTGQGVYMSGVAEELTGDDLERGLEVYPGRAERGARVLTAEEVLPPAPFRLYRVTATEHSILCPSPSTPCPVHGAAGDHRVAVTM